MLLLPVYTALNINNSILIMQTVSLENHMTIKSSNKYTYFPNDDSLNDDSEH